jgi:hypothetical protein
MSTAVAIVVTGASVLTAVGVWRTKFRPVWSRLKVIHAIIERELTPNGGASMKDQTARVTEMADGLSHDLKQIRASQAAMTTVIDRINTRNHTEHGEMWDALAQLGYDRRKAI